MDHRRKYSDLYAAQCELDSRVSVLEKEILDIKSQRNRLCPISLLPPEVLCRILLFCKSCSWRKPSRIHSATGRMTARKPSPEQQSIVKWTVITHVCRQWRRTALEYGALWNEIDGRFSTKWLSAMEQRSLNIPVIITFRPNDMNNLHTQKTLFRAISAPERWKVVDLLWDQNSILSSVPETLLRLRRSAPSVIKLKLTNSESTLTSLPADVSSHGLLPFSKD